MRALGPGSVSSFLKIILDVVFAALWIGVAILALLTLAALLLSFNPGLLGDLARGAADAGQARDNALTELLRNGPSIATGLLAAALYLGGVLVIVGSLRRIFTTLTAGDPFHPEFLP